MGKSSRCMGHSALTVSLETFRQTCGVKEGKAAQSKDRNMLTVVGKKKQNGETRFYYERRLENVFKFPPTLSNRE